MKSTFCLKVTNPSTIAQRRDIGGYDDGGGDHDEGVNTNSHIYITQAARARKGEKEDSEQRKKNDQKQKIRQRERERWGGVGKEEGSQPPHTKCKQVSTNIGETTSRVGWYGCWLAGWFTGGGGWETAVANFQRRAAKLLLACGRKKSNTNTKKNNINQLFKNVVEEGWVVLLLMSRSSAYCLPQRVAAAACCHANRLSSQLHVIGLVLGEVAEGRLVAVAGGGPIFTIFAVVCFGCEYLLGCVPLDVLFYLGEVILRLVNIK